MIQDIEFVFASVASGEWTKEEFETWCVRSRTVVDDAYNDAYHEGYNDAYHEGYNDAYHEGYNDAYHEGYNEGYDAGAEDNYTKEE